MGLPSHQHQNPNTIPPHQHRIQVPSHPISTRLPLPSHPIYTRRRLPSHPINAFLRVSHPIPSHQCISSCFPSHRITIIKESDSHPIFVMVKLKKIPACGGLSDGIPSHVVRGAFGTTHSPEKKQQQNTCTDGKRYTSLPRLHENLPIF